MASLCLAHLQTKHPPLLWDSCLWCQPQGAGESEVPRTLLGAEGFQSSPSATAQHRLIPGLTQQLEDTRGFPASAEFHAEMLSSAFRGLGDFLAADEGKVGKPLLKDCVVKSSRQAGLAAPGAIYSAADRSEGAVPSRGGSPAGGATWTRRGLQPPAACAPSPTGP